MVAPARRRPTAMSGGRQVDAEVARAAGFGGKPHSTLRPSNFRRHTKRGSALKGWFTITWLAGGVRFVDCAAFVGTDGRAWVALPAAPTLGAGGEPVIVNGRRVYRPLVQWRNRERAEEFSKLALAALLRRFPDALDVDQPPLPLGGTEL